MNYRTQQGKHCAILPSELNRAVQYARPVTPPNWAGKGKYEMTPIPDAPLISVCVDIFSLPEVEWGDNIYDAAVLCVDRHSGWMIAQPTQHKGLTAEKCAHLLLDGGWTHFGVPSVVTSDQGPQFAGQWFKLCVTD
jgi:hypothetical protein